jgi:hypothetical protein
MWHNKRRFGKKILRGYTLQHQIIRPFVKNANGAGVAAE